jgi:pyruvate-ferredoxin/flavodoxin oxidoreductase
MDATQIAASAGISGRINLIMQAAFCTLANVLEVDTAIKLLKASVIKNYGHQGEKVDNANLAAIDQVLAGIIELAIPASWEALDGTVPSRFDQYDLSDIVRKEMVPLFELRGNEMKASELNDIWSVLPSESLGWTKCEKRGIAVNIPVWNGQKCVQCNQCSLVCAHAVIRLRLLRPGSGLAIIPSRQFPGYDFRIDVSPYDCLGCGVCVQNCPTKALSFSPATDALFELQEKANVVADGLPDVDSLASADAKLRKKLYDGKYTPDGSQYLAPILEYSGAYGGCHETL